MAKMKKNVMGQILVPAVDGTDFATIESGITASNFESKMTKKFFGVNHGVSTAFTSGTISKAATLVRSGIFQQTLKATETNYDQILVSFMPANASLAQQIMIYDTVDNDDADIVSLISDVNSNLLSYLAGMSGAISDVESQVDLIATSAYLSDVQSNLLSYLTGMSGALSDVDSQVLLNASVLDSVFSVLSNLDSNFGSRVPKLVATDSQVSDLASDLRSYLVGMSGALSDVESQVDLLATSDYLSGLHSDLYSAIGGVTATLSASDISDITSAVWSADYSVLGAAASSFGSRFNVNTSRLSDVYSLVSDVDSQVNLLGTSDYLSQIHSDLGSKIGNVSVVLTASDISDIASAVTAAGVNISASDMSDIVSRVWSEKYNVHSAVNSSFGSFVTQQAQGASNLLSNISGLVSDVESQLDKTDVGLTSQFLLTLSAVSDAQSAATAAVTAANTAASIALVAASNASDAHSLTLFTATFIASQVSDLHSAVDSQFVWTSNILSDIQSDLSSQFDGLSGMISDLDSQLDLNASVISDIDSQLTLTNSLLSDVESAVDAIWTTAITEAYAADAAAFTPAQALYQIWGAVAEFSISGTTLTVKKLDGSTTAMTFTLDDATDPTSRTRAT
jgi:hypothetical protein